MSLGTIIFPEAGPSWALHEAALSPNHTAGYEGTFGEWAESPSPYL